MKTITLRTRMLFPVVMGLSGLIALSSCAALRTPLDEGDVVKVGDRVPVFSAQLHNGALFSTHEITTPLLLVFFSAQCLDCRRELPEVQQLLKKPKYSGLRTVCISRADADSAVSAFWQQKKLTLDYSAQPDRSIYSLFAQRTIPRLYVVDVSGIVKAVFREKISMRKLAVALDSLVAK